MSGQPQPNLTDLLKQLAQHDDRLVHMHVIPGREAEIAAWPQWIPTEVINAWENRGVSHLWSHQARGLEAIHSSNNVVIATGTGSGKSLVAWTPILSDLVRSDSHNRISDVHRRPTCLYLSPTKALGADQFTNLDALLNGAPAASPLSSSSPPNAPLRSVRAAPADGDTPREAKNWARANADIILTNPDFLHYVMLPSHERWTRFLASLRYIIIDELHHWRGITGSHIALVLRRLLRLCHHLGTKPQVIMLSATVKDPQLVGAAMIGHPVIAITHDGSPAATHHLALWQGPLVSDESEVDISDFMRALNGEDVVLEAPTRRRSSPTESAQLTAALVEAGARVLTFVRSRQGAEAVAAQVRDRLSARGSPEAGKVAAYRGGYLPQERRALEKSLKSGDIRALATTSALELGLDISGLDATVTAGWPGTRASLFQQIGRAGRAGKPGVSVLVASDNPLDAYLVRHPEELLGPVEAAVIDPTNPWVLAPHLCAAAAELPLLCDEDIRGTGRRSDEFYFGNGFVEIAQQLTQQQYLRRRPHGWYWDATRRERPSDLTDLRGATGDVQIVDVRTGAVIGTVDESGADSQVFPDAIYVHQGRTFHVLSLSSLTATAGEENPLPDASVHGSASDTPHTNECEPRSSLPGVFTSDRHGSDRASAGIPSLIPQRRNGEEYQRIAIVEEVRTPLRTRAKQHTSVSVRQSERHYHSSDGLLTWKFGAVDVVSRVTDFDLLRLPNLEFIRNRELSLPTRTLPTKAAWFIVEPGALSVIGIKQADLAGALHAAEHAMIGILPLLATCDRWDLGGLSTVEHEDTGGLTVFIHDAYRGGAGHAATGFERAEEWVSATLDAVRSCDCSDGCPSCIQSPKCGNGNEPLSKTGAIAVLEFVRQRCPM